MSASGTSAGVARWPVLAGLAMLAASLHADVAEASSARVDMAALGGGLPTVSSNGRCGGIPGLSLAWQSEITAADLGGNLTGESFFGPGGRARHPDGYRTYGVAPDGRVAVQENVPAGEIPPASLHSPPLPPGVTRACTDVSFYLPAAFEFPSQCGNTAPGKGRWPVGLWIGPPELDRVEGGSGGVLLAEQQTATIRLNRDRNGRAGQHGRANPYVYALNRSCPAAAERCHGRGVMDLLSPPAPRDRWFTVSLYVSMNTPGREDGCVALWHDGQKTGEHCAFDFGADRGWMVRGIYGFSMWHCNGSPREQKFWFGDYRLYTD